MGPEELDSLLESIREEGKKESALALYSGTRGTDLVNESIDERILNILGLNQVFDIDYSTYLTLLREKLAQVNLNADSLAREEQMLLQEEFKRVKGSVGRFKINRRTVNVGAIAGSKPLNISKDKFFLTSNAVIPENPGIKNISEDLTGVQKSLDKLLGEIRADNEEEKKQEELERRQKITNRRISREKLLEKSQQKVSQVVNKLFTPVSGILDKIFRFLFFGLLGNAFQSFINWFSDPKNKKQVSTMLRFVEDFWPALLGGLALFFTPLGGFIRGIVGILTKFGPKLLSLVLRNPKIFAIAAVAGSTAALINRSSNAAEDIIGEQGKADSTPEEQAEELSKPFNLLDIFTRSIVPPSRNDDDSEPPIQGRSRGGEIYNISNYFDMPVPLSTGKVTSTTGTKIKGAGLDTQLVAAQPGEFIISKNAVNTYGTQFFMNLNKEGGGTNIPQFIKSNKIQLAKGGGIVGRLVGSPTMSSPSGGLMGSSTAPNTSGGLMGSLTAPNTSGGLMGSPTMSSPSGGLIGSKPIRTTKNFMRVFDNKSSNASLNSEISSRVSINNNRINYNNNMMSPVQKTILPPEPPVISKTTNMTMLPEIVRNSESKMQTSASSSSVSNFSPSQSNNTRQLNFAVYGIEGIG